jgi:non-heme chloroperoxidase
MGDCSEVHDPMHSFETPDGVTVRYRDEGAGRPFVLLHGCWMSSRFFDPLSERLSGSYRVVRPDFRGHGASDRSLAGHTVPRYARDVAGLIEELDLRDAIVVGWSMGAFVLWELVFAGHGDRLSGAVIVDQGGCDLRSPDWPCGFVNLAELTELMRAIQEDWASVVAEIVPRMFQTERREEELDWMRSEVEHVSPAIAASILFDQTLRDYRHRLHEITLKTLVCFGADEKIMPVELGRHLARGLPDASLEIFRRSGHCPFFEEPDRFAETVTEFAMTLEQIAGKGSGLA